jgi:hypothetical protein
VAGQIALQDSVMPAVTSLLRIEREFPDIMTTSCTVAVLPHGKGNEDLFQDFEQIFRFFSTLAAFLLVVQGQRKHMCCLC